MEGFIQQALEQQVLGAVQAAEDAVDDELHRLENLTEVRLCCDSGLGRPPSSETPKTGPFCEFVLTHTAAPPQDDLEEIRRKRLEQMKRTANKRQEWLAKGHGEYKELLGEKARTQSAALVETTRQMAACGPSPADPRAEKRREGTRDVLVVSG